MTEFTYRDHRGSLEESLVTTRQFNSKQELVEYLAKDFYGDQDINNIRTSYYGYDARINQHVYIVELPSYGVFGWTNKPL